MVKLKLLFSILKVLFALKISQVQESNRDHFFYAKSIKQVCYTVTVYYFSQHSERLFNIFLIQAKYIAMDGEISYASNVRLPSLNKTFHYSYKYSRNWIGIRGRYSGRADEIGIGLEYSGYWIRWKNARGPESPPLFGTLYKGTFLAGWEETKTSFVSMVRISLFLVK